MWFALGFLTLGLALVTFSWFLVGTRAAALTLIATTTIGLAQTPLLSLPADLVTRSLYLVGVGVVVTGGYLAGYILCGVCLSLTHRAGRWSMNRLLAPHDADDPTIPDWKRAVLHGLTRVTTTANHVLTDYFLPGQAMVGTNPRYFRLRQRRSYFHADPDTVNYELQWLHDHLQRDDEDAQEHVERLQDELDADRHWSP